MLDLRSTMAADTGKGRRANRKESMARRRYQVGCLFIRRGKRRKVWVARWREDVIRTDGTLGRVLRSEVLGPVSEISSKREALSLLETRIRPINQGRHRLLATITFGAFVTEQFEPGVMPTFKYSTQRGYASLLRKHLIPRFEHQRLCDFNRSEIQQFVLGKLQRGYAWEMASRIQELLSNILGTAMEWGYLLENPARGIKMPERTQKRPHTSLSVIEVRTLLAALNEPEKTFILIAVLGGLRVGELLALRWGRVDLAQGSLRVEETCYLGRFGTPKTRSSRRTVALAPIVVSAIVSHRSRCLDTSSDALVFGTRDGLPRKVDQIRDLLKQACKRAGIRETDFHTLRHTHSTLLHATGTPLKVVQAQLGHSSMAMTLGVYTHALPDAQQEAVVKLQDVLFPNVPNIESGNTGQETQIERIQ
jgi:integrase